MNFPDGRVGRRGGADICHWLAQSARDWPTAGEDPRQCYEGGRKDSGKILLSGIMQAIRDHSSWTKERI